jgi:membrane protein DedA with SNARE-associated domain
MINHLLESLASWGYIGIIIALSIEVIPSEIVLAYAGYLVMQGHISFWGAVIAGSIGGVIAQLVVYAIGYYGGRPFVLKYGKYILIQPKHIQTAEQWFARYGTPVVFFARFIPVVRHAISIPAGISKMNLWKFSIYTLIASVPWSIIFITIGKVLGENWGNAKSQISSTWFIVFALVGLVLVYIVHRMMRKQKVS